LGQEPGPWIVDVGLSISRALQVNCAVRPAGRLWALAPVVARDDAARADALDAHLGPLLQPRRASRHACRAGFDSLTGREREIFGHLTEGKSWREIG
jgi:hypothetical protein